MRPFPQRKYPIAFAFWSIGAIFLLCTFGFAFATSGVLSAQPENVRFHQVVVNEPNTMTVSLINNGSASLTVTQVTQNRPEFQVKNLPIPITLRAGQSVQFQVVFTPGDVGRVTDQIGFINDGANSPYYMNVHGSGVPTGALTPNPATLRVGNVQVGGNDTQYVTLTNNGNSRITISSATVTGGGFDVSGLNLPATLDGGKGLTFGVVFTPVNDGDSYGYVAIHSDAPNPSFRIGLGGNGTRAGMLTVSPTLLDFGNVQVGNNKTLNGQLAATVSDVNVTSAVLSSSEFTLQGLSLPVLIHAGSKVSFQIKFTPSERGRASGKISFVSNAANSPTAETLTGVGAGNNHSVDLTWNASKSQDVIGYNVYRKVQHQGSFEKLNSSLDPSTNYTDDNVLGGVTYVYVTTAVDSAGNESKRSNKAVAQIPYP
jgi:hypothetical protein